MARREYVERLRSRTFLLGMFLPPACIAGALLIPGPLRDAGGTDVLRVELVDAGNGVNAEILRRAEEWNVRPGAKPRYLLSARDIAVADLAAQKERLSAIVVERGLTGALILEPGLVSGRGQALYLTLLTGLRDTPRELRRWVEASVRMVRLRRLGVKAKAVAKVEESVRLEPRLVGPVAAIGNEQLMAQMLAPVVAACLLLVGILLACQFCLTSLIEEKSSRVVEVVLAAMSPMEFMSGKILGNGLAGLVVCGVWGSIGYAIAVSKGVEAALDPAHAGLLALYFLLGFALFAALYCAAGAACQTVQEAQNLMMPLNVLSFVPLLLVNTIVIDPSSWTARLLTLVPPITPFVMMCRLAVPPGPGVSEIALSFIVLGAGVWASAWAAARIFRVGILMHGKTASLAELWRWVRTP